MKNYPKRPINSLYDSEDVSISDIHKNRVFDGKLLNSLKDKARAVKITKSKSGVMDIITPIYPEARDLLERWNNATQKEKVAIREVEENKENIIILSKTLEDIKKDSTLDKKSKNPKTDIKNGEGFLLFRGEKISLGLSSSGKFKLAEILCNESFGKAKTLDTVFGVIKKVKDKNKTDNRLSDNHIKSIRIVELLKGLVKEINRDITSYAVGKKIKDFNYRLSLEAEIKQNTPKVWLREKVGRGG